MNRGWVARRSCLDCIDTNWVSTAGKYVTQFEQMVAKATGAAHAIAIVNGTAALHAALLLEGVQANDEVILPTITFVATANAVSHAGAIPHLVDSSWDTLGLDPVALDAHLAQISVRNNGETVNRETGRRLRAIVPVHIFGHPVDMAPLNAVAEKYGLVVVEDATESLGSTWNGQACGTFGHSAVLSFNGNKIITTGGGGMILTNDDEHARHARHFTSTAKKSHAWSFDHDEIASITGFRTSMRRLVAGRWNGCRGWSANGNSRNAIWRCSRISSNARFSASRRGRGAITGSTRW